MKALYSGLKARPTYPSLPKMLTIITVFKKKNKKGAAGTGPALCMCPSLCRTRVHPLPAGTGAMSTLVLLYQVPISS